MFLISNHLVLVSATTLDSGCAQVHTFFKNSLLIQYDRIDFRREKCHRGSDKNFEEVLKVSLEDNKKILNSFIREFSKTGFENLADLRRVEYGYPSKLLHIIAHFLDGFIGIDTIFYNLIEDSHWISEETTRAIEASPDSYWLIHLDCYSATPDEVALVQQ